jgi:DNA helicase-2/ATP-dependent DNA helicase PcrA
LQQLFHHHSVLAVGDPNQSIYGWRGASASNLATFGADFGDGFGVELGQVQQFKLQTSWRNPEIVLDVANAIASPLATPPSYLHAASVGEKLGVAVLQPRTGAGVGSIAIDAFETSYEEADAVADWFAAKFGAAQKAGQKPTGAVLMRNRANMELFRLALESRGLQAEPVGLDGLLQTPEVFDLICALRVIHTPNSGSSLMRLLAGPRWRLGVKDLNALFEYAKSQDSKHYKLHDRGQVYAPEDVASTVDALESLLDERRVPSGQMSDEGFDRMRDAAALFQQLRRQVGLPLVEFVNLVLQSLWLDIEVEANPNRPVPMANLNAFLEKVNSFTETSNNATLGNFLEWLDYLQARERNEVPTVAQKAGVVQLLTVHAAKGLEWQYVAVPEMVTKDADGLGGWVSAGKLPYPLRGDAHSLPQLDLESVHSQEDYGVSYKQFRADMREHLEREERRVAYVAVTRPEKELFASISYWKPGTKKSANKPNEYFLAIAETLCSKGIISEAKFEALKSGSKYDDVPETINSAERQWPLEPLGEKHAVKFRQAASEVSAADAKSLGESSLSKNIDRLLLERQQLDQQAPLVELPVRIPASVFHKYIYEFETMVKASHRPMPEEPYKQSLTGTEFHGWLERQFGQGIAIDFDALDEPLDEEDETKVDIAALQATFAKSPWADLTPYEVEIEIQVAIDQNIFICKLDAVYKTETGYQIVDWKTGKPPADQKDEDAKGLQLSLYRMALARHLKKDPETISCVLYYVTEDKILEPPIKTEAELIELWQSVLAKVKPLDTTD